MPTRDLPDATSYSPLFHAYTAGTNRDLGNLVVISESGDTETVPFLAGETQQLRCKNTVAAGSTVTNILVMW